MIPIYLINVIVYFCNYNRVTVYIIKKYVFSVIILVPTQTAVY